MKSLGLEMSVHIYQIYYDSASKSKIDPDFSSWDNSTNERPDWAEYWSIRKIWASVEGELKDNDYLGIFSPRFQEKTGMTGAAVLDIVRKCNQPVVSFSPFLTHIALYSNVFEQGERYHPGLRLALCDSLKVLGYPIEWSEVLGTMQNTIFSNYFVAQISVWKKLMGWIEELFEIAEANDTPLAKMLNARVRYIRGATPMKVFVFERLISVLLWKEGINAQLGMDFSSWKSAKRVNDEQFSMVLRLDALKSQFLRTGCIEYLNQFFHARGDLMLERP